MLSYFAKGKNSAAFEKQICEKLLDEVMTLVPTLENQFILIRKELDTQTKQEMDKIQIGNMFEKCVTKVTDAITITDYNPTEDIKKKIKNKIEENKLIIEVNQELSDPEKRYRKRVQLAKHWCDNMIGIKNNISIMSLGKSQTGKTSLVKKMFNLSNKIVKIKGGLGSDTDKVKTHTKIVNGVKLLYADTPGFFDSRGKDKDKENNNKIIEYIQNNEIDVIFWVAKIIDIFSLEQQDLLRQLITKFGDGILKKMLIVLTHANGDAPLSYYHAYLKENKKKTDNTNKDNNNSNNDNTDDDADDDTYDTDDDTDDSDNDDDIILSNKVNHKEVWKRYIKDKKDDWQNKMNIIQDELKLRNKVTIPVVCAENDTRYTIPMKDEKNPEIITHCLRDGTPILETIMTEILKLVQLDKAPIAFLAMTDEEETSETVPPKPPSRPTSPPQVNHPDVTSKAHIPNPITITVPAAVPVPYMPAPPPHILPPPPQHIPPSPPPHILPPPPTSSISSPAPVTITQPSRPLNERQRALDKAINNITSESNNNGSWWSCTLF